MLRCTSLTMLFAVMGLVVASAAPAATIDISGGTLTFQGAGSEENWPQISEGEDGKLDITDFTSYITAWPPECETGYDEESLVCPMPDRYVAQLGGGDDRHGLGSSLPGSLAIEMYGGAGNDRLDPFEPETGNGLGASRLADGGDGDDSVVGSLAGDVLRGGAGNDTVFGYGGADDVSGGDGDDRLSGDDGHHEMATVTAVAPDVVDGGGGFDFFTDYGQTGGAADVTIDGRPGDGRAGEGDNLISIEHVDAHAFGSWVLTEGDDRIYVFPRGGRTVVRGLGGNDRLEGDHDTEELDGGPGDDHVEGGYNDDILTGGPGRDRIVGDEADSQCGIFQSCTAPAGNDTIHARDGEVDSIDCGVGADRAIVDSIDAVANCESVEVEGGGGDQQGNDRVDTPPPPRSPDAETCQMPKVAGVKVRVALRRVRAAGCKTRVKRVRHRRVKKGRVIRASVKAGRVVAHGTRVTIVVSKGRR